LGGGPTPFGGNWPGVIAGEIIWGNRVGIIAPHNGFAGTEGLV